MTKMLLRVRSNVGQWRIDVSPTATVVDVMTSIAETRPTLVYERPLSTDAACNLPLDSQATLAEQGITHEIGRAHV